MIDMERNVKGREEDEIREIWGVQEQTLVKMHSPESEVLAVPATSNQRTERDAQ